MQQKHDPLDHNIHAFKRSKKRKKNTNVVKSVKKMNKFLSGKGLYIKDIWILILLTFCIKA